MPPVPRFPRPPAVVLFLLLCVAVVGAALSAARAVTFPATADAHARLGGNSGSNYGAADTLELQAGATGDDGNTRKTWWKFNVASLAGTTVTRASLTVTYAGASATFHVPRTFRFFAIPDGADAWGETTLNGDNAPGTTTGYGFAAGAVDLGTVTVGPNTPAGTALVLPTSTALVNFLQSGRGADNLITIAARAEDPGPELHRLASRENGAYAEAVLEVNTGTVAPVAPTGLAATATAANAVNLSWNTVNGETGFTILRSTTAGTGYVPVGAAPANATSYTDTTTNGATPYFYVVRAVNVRGASGNSNQASVTPPDWPRRAWYVAPPPAGVNAAPPARGTVNAPFATVDYAFDHAQPGDTVYLRAGTYRETVSPPRDGLPGAEITVTPYPGETATVTGLNVITPAGGATWQAHNGSANLHKIPLTTSSGFGAGSVGRNQVFVDGVMMTEARWPNVPADADVPDPFSLRRTNFADADAGTDDPATETGPSYARRRDGTYTDAALVGASFAADAWAGGKMRLVPGKGWGAVGADVLGNSGSTVRMNGRFGDQSFNHPATADPYFLFGRLVALDAPGECFLDVDAADGPANTLYLWPPGGGSPAGRTVELRERDLGFDLSWRSHLRLDGLRLLAARILGTGTRNLTLTNLQVEAGQYDLDLLRYIGNGGAINLRGTGNRLLDSAVTGSTDTAIVFFGNDHEVRHNVFRECTNEAMRVGGASFYEHNTVADCGGGGINFSGVRGPGRVARNHVYRQGLLFTDIGSINAIGAGDMNNVEVAYNWVHDNRAVRDGSRGWNGGPGIRLDTDASNVLIHHNVVWNMTQESGIIVWAMVEGFDNYGDMKVRILHNTVDGEIHGAQYGGGTNPSIAGLVVRNNIAFNGWDDPNVALTGATVTDNLFPRGNAPAGNETGTPGFVAPWQRNWTLRADSPAVDAGATLVGVNDGGVTLGAGPDLGAFERGRAPWVAGALVRPRDLPGLNVRLEDTLTGTPRFVVSGLPPGRSLPETARLRVGGTVATAGPLHRYDFAADTAEAVFSGLATGGMNGSQTAELALDGTNFVPFPAPVAIPAFGITATSLNAAHTTGGTTVTLTGRRFHGRGEWLTPLTLTNLMPGDFHPGAPVPVRLDAAALAAAGKLRADAADLRFLSADGAPLEHWVDGPANSANAVVWLQRADPPDVDNLTFDDGTAAVYLAHGNPALTTSASNLAAVWPDLTLPSLELWLKAHAITGLADNARVSLWPDASAADHDASQATTALRPTFQSGAADLINGLPVVRFDGATSPTTGDFLEVGDGLGQAPYTTFAVYRNPAPGTASTYQRLLSSGAPSGADHEDGLALLVPYGSGGTATAHAAPTLAEQSDADVRDLRALTLGRRSDLETAYYAGDLAEVLCFTQALGTPSRTQVRNYLQRKYALAPAGSGTLDLANQIAPLTLTVGGVPATNLRVLSPTQLTFTLPATTAVANVTPADLVLNAASTTGANTTLSGQLFRFTKPIDGWRIAQFLLAPGGPTGPLAQNGSDRDGDGLNTALEYALGTDPNAASVTGLPAQSFTTVNTNRHLTLSVPRNPAASDVTYTVKVASSPGGPWSSGTGSTTVLTNTSSLLKVRDNTPVAGSGTGATRFMRLEVIVP